MVGLPVLKRIGSIADGGPVLAPHSADATYARADDGTQWIRKREIDTGFQPLLAEAVSWLLAQELGMNIPEAAVYEGLEEDRSWLSQYVQAAKHWDPEQAAYVTNIEEFGAVLVLNVLVLNEDCHAGNILLQPDPDRLHLKLWPIDFGNALVGYISDYEERKDELPSVDNLCRGIPVELVEQRALELATDVSKFKESFICHVVSEGCQLVREPDSARISRVLVNRCQLAPIMIKRYLERVRART